MLTVLMVSFKVLFSDSNVSFLGSDEENCSPAELECGHDETLCDDGVCKLHCTTPKRKDI